MFVKLFRSIYDGTLADNWKALVTFQQLLILSDEQGTVDMTLSAMARVTGIPQDILREGIALLESPDEESRTPDAEGRRIVRLDSHREWGWTIVNFRKYRELRSREDKREADRVRIATKREEARRAATNRDMSQDVAACRVVSQSVAEVAQAEAEEEREKKDQERREPKLTLVTAEPVPPAAAAVAATVQESIFRSGVAYLVSAGTGEAIARSQLGKLRQIAQGAAGGDRDRGDVILLDCLGEAERQGIINPFPWLSKAVLARTVSKPDPDSDLSWMDRKVFV